MADVYRLSYRRAANGAAIRRALPVILILLTGIAFRHFVVMNWDVSWLITVGEKMLDGQRFGRDILEINPPASPLLYMPAILIARTIGITPEFVVDTMTFAVVGASVALSARILAPTRIANVVDGWLLAAFAVAILAILPAFSFSQREHIAVILLLPSLAVATLRAQEGKPHPADVIFAGLGVGIAVAIKPYFAAAVVFAALAAALHARSWRPIFALENWIGAGIALVYAASVFVFFPDYIINVLPMVRDLYLPDRLPWLNAVFHPAVLLWLGTLAIVAVVRPRALLEPLDAVLAAASAGFALSFVAQGKGWPYHAYPMFALALLAVGAVYARTDVSDVTPRWRRGLAGLAAAALIVKLCLWFNTSMDTKALADAIEKIHRQPRIALIGSEIVLGHPLVRQINGTWVNRDLGQWITTGAQRRREIGGLDDATRQRIETYEALDRDATAEDIVRGHPDIIIVDRRDFDWLAWANADAKTKAALSNYHEAQTIDGIAIFSRGER